MEETASGLKYYDYRKSTGAQVKAGQVVIVHYKVVKREQDFDHGPYLEDSWAPPERRIKFRVGNGEVIKGVDEGIQGMRVSGYRRMIVPPHLAFGERGIPGRIDPYTTLVFEVYAIEIIQYS